MSWRFWKARFYPLKRWRIRIDRPVRRFLPRSFLGRSLLIVLVPLLVTQGIFLGLFYGNYLNIVSRRLSADVASEIRMTLDLFERFPSRQDRMWVLERSQNNFLLSVRWREGGSLKAQGYNHVLGPMDKDFYHELTQLIQRPFFIDWHNQASWVNVFIQFPDGMLEICIPKKRLGVGPIWFFVVWCIGSSVILFCIAGFFIYKQVRAIRLLTRAAELFGMGQDPGYISPAGAREIRMTAVAFNRMRDRIQRFVSARTAILAGVSHDLRTPLTRLRLTLAMIPTQGNINAPTLQEDIADMVADVEEMERLIGEYLAFARGEGAEQPQITNLAQLLEEVATSAQRAGARLLPLQISEHLPDMVLRVGAIKRALSNILDNARKHASQIRISVEKEKNRARILIDDNGPGILPEHREAVFQAFHSKSSGGTGLGMTISRDIIHAHGGDIKLQDSPMGGLRVRIELPI